MNFIKKIADNKIDELVHLQFQKFSRGEFRDRACFKAKNSSGKYTISTTAEFGNELVRILAEKLGDKKTKVTGSIIGTNDLKGILEFKKIKQFQGVKNYSIEMEMSGKEILNLLNKFPKNFFGLTFSVGDEVLKIKPKTPKSGKPSTKEGEGPKADFCKLVTTDKKLAESFVFEKPDFKIAEISHDYIIESIVVPESLKNEKDFAVVREKSLRKGKIIRRGNIDGETIKRELKFEA
jgi:hypothetical protein